MFTAKEDKILQILQQDPGEIVYFKDIAQYFISKSQLEISTFSQLAYINLPADQSSAENITNALSEYFEVLVFIQKLEQQNLVFHIPFTPLEDNTTKIGIELENKVHNTIADADLLIQLFQYAGKKYVFIPEIGTKKNSKNILKASDFFRIALLTLLILFIAFTAYHAHLERKQIDLHQKQITLQIKGNETSIKSLEDQFRINNKSRFSEFEQLGGQMQVLNDEIKSQQKSFNYLRNFHRKQASSLIILQSKLDSVINYNDQINHIIPLKN